MTLSTLLSNFGWKLSFSSAPSYSLTQWRQVLYAQASFYYRLRAILRSLQQRGDSSLYFLRNQIIYLAEAIAWPLAKIPDSLDFVRYLTIQRLWIIKYQVHLKFTSGRYPYMQFLCQTIFFWRVSDNIGKTIAFPWLSNYISCLRGTIDKINLFRKENIISVNWIIIFLNFTFAYTTRCLREEWLTYTLWEATHWW